MTIEKWNEKINAMFDGASLNNSENLYFDNDSDGAYFCTDGFRAFFLPGSEILTAAMRENHRFNLSGTFRAASEHAVLADSSESVTLPNNRKGRKFTNGNTTVYAQEKFLRVFPKNTSYYISAPYKPIVAGIWENDRLHTIGIVLPILVRA